MVGCDSVENSNPTHNIKKRAPLKHQIRVISPIQRAKGHINDKAVLYKVSRFEEINVEKIKLLNRWVANDGLEVATAYQN